MDKKENNFCNSISRTPYPISRFLTRGLTLVEILVVLAIMGILAVIVSSSLTNFNTVQKLQAQTSAAASLIARAQSQSLAGTGGAAHGVHFASTTISLFTGSSYAASSTNQTLALIGGVTVAQVNLTGSGVDVIFDQLTGATEEPGTIVLEISTSTSYQKTITITGTGVVSVK